MEAYFSVVAKPKTKTKTKTEGSSSDAPSKHLATTFSSRHHKSNAPSVYLSNSLSSAEITRGLLTSLKDPSNPITHSTLYERTEHIVSFSTGHQVSDGHKKQSKDYSEQRGKKIKAQQSSATSGILGGTRIYIDGYLEDTTDIEMKRIITEAGGQIMPSASRCTHILSSRGLSGSKTDAFLTKKSRNTVHIVKPAWVLDSIALGKRRPERSYASVKAGNTLQNFLKS